MMEVTFKKDKAYIKIVNKNFCCVEMEEAWNEKFIGFGDFDSDGNFDSKYIIPGLTTDTDINIYKCDPYPEGAVWGSYPIKYCPFCAKENYTIEK